MNVCIMGIGVLGSLSKVSYEGLGLLNVAPERIQTRHLPYARQALYHYATAQKTIPSPRMKFVLQLYIESQKKKKMFSSISLKNNFFCFCFWETKKFYIFSMCFGPRRSFYEKSSGVLRTKLKLLNFINIFLLTLTQGQRSNFKVKLEIW